jgi:hypothetical protein
MYLDLSRVDDLKKEVFHKKVLVDYTSMLGGEPYEVSGEKQVDTWMKQLGGLDSWVHVTT